MLLLLTTGNSSFTLLSHSLQEPGQERLRGVGRRAAQADVRPDEGQPHQETGKSYVNKMHGTTFIYSTVSNEIGAKSV